MFSISNTKAIPVMPQGILIKDTIIFLKHTAGSSETFTLVYQFSSTVVAALH